MRDRTPECMRRSDGAVTVAERRNGRALDRTIAIAVEQLSGGHTEHRIHQKRYEAMEQPGQASCWKVERWSGQEQDEPVAGVADHRSGGTPKRPSTGRAKLADQLGLE